MRFPTLLKWLTRCDPRAALKYLVRFHTMAILLLAFSGERAQAAATVWDGGGANANWDTANNWDSNSVPGSNEDITFGTGFGSGTAINLNGNRSVKTLTISTTT